MTDYDKIMNNSKTMTELSYMDEDQLRDHIYHMYHVIRFYLTEGHYDGARDSVR